MVFVRGTGGRSVEGAATEAMNALRIGAQTRRERGLLVLLDVEQRRLKAKSATGSRLTFRTPLSAISSPITPGSSSRATGTPRVCV
jgi:hypothetical protein